jgi:hypothetical protein
VVVLGHLCRGEGATGTRRLLARAARWVVPHGRLIVTDYLLPADGPATPTVAVMGVTAMANSATGGPLHRDELEGMVRSSGFDRLEHVHVGSTDVVLARRSAP